MFAAQVFTALLAVAAPLLVRADVTPNEPGPGDIFNTGAPCNIKWTGDEDSTTAWKDMSIELMTGSDLGQVHITTVATGQDGTVDGSFSYTCPEVIPNSAIYFYQFSSADSSALAWTTRFTIASSTGATTPPPNATQPGSNKAIPWGMGALADPSKAVAAPIRGTATGNTTSVSASVPVASVTGSASASASASKIVTSASVQSLAASASGSASSSASTPKATSAASTLSLSGRVLATGALIVAAFMW